MLSSSNEEWLAGEKKIGDRVLKDVVLVSQIVELGVQKVLNEHPSAPVVLLGRETNQPESPWIQVHTFGSCGLQASTSESDIDLYAELFPVFHIGRFASLLSSKERSKQSSFLVPGVASVVMKEPMIGN